MLSSGSAVAAVYYVAETELMVFVIFLHFYTLYLKINKDLLCLQEVLLANVPG